MGFYYSAVTVSCDSCPRTIRCQGAGTFEQAQSDAHRRGWRFVAGKASCPGCEPVEPYTEYATEKFHVKQSKP